MCFKKLSDKLEKVDNPENKISTKGFLIFAFGMISVILALVVVLSLI